MLSVTNDVKNHQPSFKQNEAKSDPTKSFETHAGLKTGAVYSGIGAATSLSAYAIADKFLKAGKSAVEEIGDEAAHEAGDILSEASKYLKSAGKKLWFTIPLSVAICAGCGALIDKITNDNRAKFDKENEGKDSKTILKSNPDAELTRTGEVYQKSSTGKKYGTLLGAVVLPVWAKLHQLITKTKSPIGIISNIIIGAIGGLTLGAITDHYANKGAIKHADNNTL